jgi:Eco57I restriction-modification methylase
MLPGFRGHLLSEAFLEREMTSASAPDIDRFRHAMIAWRAASRQLGPASSVRTLLHVGAAPLVRSLGFDTPSDVVALGSDIAATIFAGASPVALVVSTWGERLDSRWRAEVTEAMRRGASWCLVFNGSHLRIVDAGRLYARRHIEFDVQLACDDVRTCAALWTIARASVMGADAANSSSLHAMVVRSDRHATTVCRSLREGVLSASQHLLSALMSRNGRAPRTSITDCFEQALTIVYRIVFLLFAEARALVPVWHPVYRESYSIEALRDAAERRAWPAGLWDALRAIARLAHSGCRAGDLRVTPFNGRLFSPARAPLAERRNLDDRLAQRAILALSTRAAPDGAGRERIAYRDLGVEQLGAVYETLLDYEPRVEGRDVRLEAGSGVRKATGTFYTPQPVAEYLVRRTLAPLVKNLVSEEILLVRVLDPSMGSGAFLVASCRYLAGAYESALVAEGACHPSDITEDDRAAMRRTIAERCLYGVDLNPMAVQLARLSLWLTTLAADRPLTFLDHRLQTGDSLLGVWLANLRVAPARRRARRTAEPSLPFFSDDAVRRALSDALPVRFSLESTPNNTLAEVRAKERALAAITARDAALSRWKRVGDVWCATWFAGLDVPREAFSSLADEVVSGAGALAPRVARQHLAAASAVADAKRFFHWELEFPEVFFGSDGRVLPNPGFDAIIGNPPWDMIRADAGPVDRRTRSRVDAAATLRFTRDSGVYSAQSDGHANRYQLFVERAIDLTRTRGRMGLVLPSGLATDHGSASLRRRLLSRCDVDAIVSVDNRRGIFPIHRSVRFLLVTASRGSPTRTIACRFDVDDPATLESAGEDAADRAAWFPVRLSPELLERISGPDLTIPSLRDPVDVAIVERAVSLFPQLGDSSGWAASFGRELNATDDRDAFRPPHSLSAGLPVLEGKHLEPFRVDVDRAAYSISRSDARRLLRSDRHAHPRLSYRDVASATNRQTLIAAVLPANCVSTHTIFCLRTALPLRAQYFLCGLFNSFVMNYLVRLRVTTHVTTVTVERLPIPPWEAAPAACREIAALARLLSRRTDPDAVARLNAAVAQVYQLSHADFEHILSTFRLVPVDERQRAMDAFRRGSR